MKQLSTLIWLLALPVAGYLQPSYTALDYVPAYAQQHYFGTNLGWYSSAWNDAKLADIAAGNPALHVTGVGARNLRISLPERFLETWGYGIELPDVQHYDALGMRELTAFLQGPSEAHRLTESFCPDISPQLFNNMYLPIWDNGENGTPVNDQNYYALYVYNTVSQYHEYVRFWEIMNEPDYTPTGFGWRESGMEGSWFDAPPNPCDLKNLKAPIFYYIRMLRIAYEVIKTVDPDAYVAIGGIGYPSFLDAVLRYTDKPEDGAVSSSFPLTGGAYFDAVSYHSYPANDGSLRYYDFDAHAFVYSRHSDAAAQGVVRLKNDFQTVLSARGYGTTYPAKRWIVTESNISRREFNDQMGSAEGQRNFIVKAMVAAMQNGIDQYYTFILADKQTNEAATNAWDLMGFYYALQPVPPYQQQVSPSGLAFKTAADLLHTYRFDNTLTTQLQLPANIGGGAFRNSDNELLFVLWAKTNIDRSEESETTYSFPASLGLNDLEKRQWNYSQNLHTTTIGNSNITLTGDPIFLLSKTITTAATDHTNNTVALAQLVPNPSSEQLMLRLQLNEASAVAVHLYRSNGQAIKENIIADHLVAGEHWLPIDISSLPAGVYLCQLDTTTGRQLLKLVIN